MKNFFAVILLGALISWSCGVFSVEEKTVFPLADTHHQKEWQLPFAEDFIGYPITYLSFDDRNRYLSVLNAKKSDQPSESTEWIRSLHPT